MLVIRVLVTTYSLKKQTHYYTKDKISKIYYSGTNLVVETVEVLILASMLKDGHVSKVFESAVIFSTYCPLDFLHSLDNWSISYNRKSPMFAQATKVRTFLTNLNQM
jgi:hypothetical protein